MVVFVFQRTLAQLMTAMKIEIGLVNTIKVVINFIDMKRSVGASCSVVDQEMTFSLSRFISTCCTFDINSYAIV